MNNGIHIKNFPSNISGLQRLFDTFEKSSMVTYTVEQIRFLRKDVAVVHVVGDMKDETESCQGRITLVMTKGKGKWLISTFKTRELFRCGAKRTGKREKAKKNCLKVNSPLFAIV